MGRHFYSIFMFLIWPFYAFYLQMVDSRKSYFIIVMFVIYAAVTQTVLTETGDIVKQKIRYERFVESNMNLLDFTNNLYKDGYSGFKNFDLVESGLWFILSWFKADVFWLDFSMGLLLGLLFAFNLRQIRLRVYELKDKRLLVLLLLFFIFITPFWAISGFRFNFASMLAFTAYIQFYLLDNRRLGILFWLLTPLAHFGFWFFLALPVLVHVLRKFTWLSIVLAIVLNLAGNVNLFQRFFNPVKSLIPQELFSQGEAYVTDEKLSHSEETINRGKSFHAAFYQESMHFYILFIALYIAIKMKWGREEFPDTLKQQLTITLLLSGFIGLVDTVPGAKRFEVIEQIMAWIFFVNYFRYRQQTKIVSILPVIRYTSPPALFWLIVEVRKSFDYFTFSTVLGNPFTAYAFSDIALIELIK